MTDNRLPPLPKKCYIGFSGVMGYGTDEMIAYGHACAEATIDAAIDIVAMHGGSVDIEAAIRTLRTASERSGNVLHKLTE